MADTPVTSAKADSIVANCAVAGVTVSKQTILDIILAFLKALGLCGMSPAQALAQRPELSDLMLTRRCRRATSSTDDAEVVKAAIKDESLTTTGTEFAALKSENGIP